MIYFCQYDMKLYLAETAAWLPIYGTDFSFERSAMLTQLHCFQLSANFFGTDLGDLSSVFHCVTCEKKKSDPVWSCSYLHFSI